MKIKGYFSTIYSQKCHLTHKFYFFNEIASLHVPIICLSIMLTSALMEKNQRQNVTKNVCIDFPDGIFVENKKGCEYFLYCRNGHAIEGFCPLGMWFNLDSGVCDQPNNVDCKLNNSNLPDVQEQDEYENIKCPSKDSGNIRFIASKLDCSRYYICYHGRAIQQQCMNNLHWNLNARKCDHPKVANCKVCAD